MNHILAEQISIQVGEIIADTTAKIFVRCEEVEQIDSLTNDQKRVILASFIEAVMDLPERIRNTIDFNDICSSIEGSE